MVEIICNNYSRSINYTHEMGSSWSMKKQIELFFALEMTLLRTSKTLLCSNLALVKMMSLPVEFEEILTHESVGLKVGDFNDSILKIDVILTTFANGFSHGEISTPTIHDYEANYD